MLKKIAPWSIGLLIILIVGVVAVLMFSQTIKPYYLGVREVEVTDQLISLKDINLSESAVNYRGYKVTYKNETIFIKIKQGSLLFKTKPIDVDDISIENSYGKVKEVYLQGNTPSENRMIWPQNTTWNK